MEHFSVRHLLRAVFFLALFFIMTSFGVTPKIAHAITKKVSVSPVAVTIPENGGTQIFTVALDEPIISNSNSNPAIVTITLTSSDPRVVLTPNVITYSSAEWSHPKNFTATTVDDAILNPNNAVTVGLSVSSNSEYYNGYTNSALVTLIDDEASDFITTWTTTTPNQQITIPTNPAYTTYNYNVNWGDGSTETGDTGNANHTYTTVGTYTVIITGTFPAIYFNSASDAPLLTSIERWGTNSWLSMKSAFYGCINFVVNATDTPDLSNVTDMSYMFKDDENFNQPINSWDVSHVTNMNAVFVNASTFNQPLNLWDVSHVTDMTGMFKNDYAFNQDLSSWNVSHVASMINMFQSVTLSVSNYDALLEAWSHESLQTGVAFFAGNSKYCLGASARASIISTYSWGILDQGLSSSCAHTLTYSAGPNGTLTGTLSQVVVSGLNGTAVTAVPDSGYGFVDWSDGSVQNPRTDSNVIQDVTVSAHFVSAPGNGSVSSGGFIPLAFLTNSTPSAPSTTQKVVVQSSIIPVHYTFTRTLALGADNEEVRHLQAFLNTHGVQVAVSGFGSLGNEVTTFGKGTQKALAKYQKINHITPASGFFGSKTMMFINKIVH